MLYTYTHVTNIVLIKLIIFYDNESFYLVVTIRLIILLNLCTRWGYRYINHSRKNYDGFQVYYENAHKTKFVIFQIFLYKNLRVSISIIKTKRVKLVILLSV